MHSNREILGAVLARWLEPVASGLFSNKLLAGMPVVQAIDAKIKSTGWVSQNWSIASEIEPLVGGAASAFVAPMLTEMMAGVPDGAIPEMARSTVSRALQMGELSLFEGKVTFDRNDLQRLERLIELNMPARNPDAYQVKE